MTFQLTEKIAQSFGVAMLYEGNDQIEAIDFSSDGKYLITCNEMGEIVLYDCLNGISTTTVNSKKYGISLIRFTQEKDMALQNSTKGDDKIRHLDVGKNQYKQYFAGHNKKVISLCISPVERTFFSGSIDRTWRLWDLVSGKCEAFKQQQGPPILACDPKGLVFAVGTNLSTSIMFYDLRRLDDVSFTKCNLGNEKFEITDMKFSPNGDMILVCTKGPFIYLFDAFDGTLLQKFKGCKKKNCRTGIPIEGSFSPDSKFVFSSGVDNCVHVWNADNGNKICAYDNSKDRVSNGNNSYNVKCVKFNPKFAMFASTCKDTSIWLPNGN